MNGRTIAEDMEREYERQSLRDHFAAAALTGLLGSGDLVLDPRNGTATTLTVLDAYRWADAMLRERHSRTGKKMSESDSFCAVCPERDNTNHDAAPAARGDARECAAPVTAGGTSVGVSATGAESGSTPDAQGFGRSNEYPCQPFDSAPTTDDAATGELGGGVGFSSGSRSGKINRTPERESPRRECEESSLRDVSRPDTKGEAAGGPEHHISEAEIDALEFVVEEGRIANVHDYGILRSLLIRLRQEWEFRDSPEPIKDDISDRPEPITIDLSQPCMVDPPSGWKWGFPRRYDPAEDGPMKEWLIRNGYPKHLADKGLTCTFTLCDKETTDK